MKLIFFIIFIGFTSASIELDWSRIGPIQAMHSEFIKNESINIVRNGRIVNGLVATPHQFPYLVALLASSPAKTTLCGGSIISPNEVLTAAICNTINANSFLVIAGAIKRNQIESSQQRRTVPASAFTPHANFNPDPNILHNNIAVLRISESFIYTSFVQAIALAVDTNETFLREIGTISGFGQTSDARASSDVVRFVAQDIVPFCGSTSQTSRSLICGRGHADIRNNPCFGDEGGPFTIQRNGKSLQVGIYSFAGHEGTCNTIFGVDYTRVTSFIRWIRNNAQL